MAKKQKKTSPRPAQTKSAQPPAAKARASAATPAGSARRWIWPMVFLVVAGAALLLSQTLFSKGTARPSEPWTLTILHTTDVAGYLDPCG